MSKMDRDQWDESKVDRSRDGKFAHRVRPYGEPVDFNEIMSRQDCLHSLSCEDISEPLLGMLSQHEDDVVRERVAEHPKATADMLDFLADDDSHKVILAVAEHPHTPTEVIDRFIQNETDDVVLIAVGNRHASAAVLREKVHSTSDPEILYQIACNRGAPMDAVTVALDKVNDDVRLEVVRNPDTSPDAIRLILSKYLTGNQKMDRNLKTAAAQHEDSPSDVLMRLASDKSSSIRMDVAKNFGAPVEVLDVLAQDSDYWILSHVASHRHTSQSAMRHMAHNVDRPEILKTIALRPDVPLDVLEHLSDHWDPAVRAAVAYNTKTPVDVIDKLKQDSDDETRTWAWSKRQ